MALGCAAAAGHVALDAVAAVAATGAVLLCLARPKVLFACAVAAAMTDEFLAALLHFPRLQLTDDALVGLVIILLPAMRLADGLPLRRPPGTAWFALYVLLGIGSGISAGVPLRIAAAGTFLASKGMCFGFSAAQVDWTMRDARTLRRLGARFGVVVLLAAAASVALPGWWLAHGLAVGDVGRLGLPTVVSIFLHAGAFSLVAGLFAVAFFAYRRTVAPVSGATAATVAFALASVLALRRTAVVALLAGLTSVRMRRDKTSTILALTIVIPTAVVLLWAPLNRVSHATYQLYLANGTTAARTILYRDSVTVAHRYFPLGAGFGRYGSHTAITHYSPVYIALGLEHVWGIQPAYKGATASSFASDTFWPAVLGEAGVFGLVAFLLGMARMLGSLRRASREQEPLVAWLGLTGIGWCALLLVASITNPVFVAPPIYPLLFALAGLTWGFTQSLSARTEPPVSESAAVVEPLPGSTVLVPSTIA